MNMHPANYLDTDYSERQAAVLEAGLELLTAGGEKALTTAGLASAANCSKESLYKWFGDRDGILEAMIVYQASKVSAPGVSAASWQKLEDSQASFVSFGMDLLRVLAGPTSLALNRLAIGQASRDGAPLGEMMVQRGRQVVRARGESLLRKASAVGYLRLPSIEDAYFTLYGLLVGDLHVRLLLGDAPAQTQSSRAIAEHVEAAIAQFYRLYAVQNNEI